MCGVIIMCKILCYYVLPITPARSHLDVANPMLYLLLLLLYLNNNDNTQYPGRVSMRIFFKGGVGIYWNTASDKFKVR